jgi:hypothetical protein
MIHHVLAEFGGHGRVKRANCENNVRVIVHSADARVEASLEQDGHELRQVGFQVFAGSIEAIVRSLRRTDTCDAHDYPLFFARDFVARVDKYSSPLPGEVHWRMSAGGG